MGAIPARRRKLLALLVAAAALVLTASGVVGCEAVLGTGDLKDSVNADATTTFEAGPGDDDDDDDDAAADASVDANRTDARSGSEAGPSDAAPRDATPNPSCIHSTAAVSCGPGASDDCCSAIKVQGGQYNRSYDAGFPGSTGSAAAAEVSAFALDRYEVTVGRFREYVSYLEDGGSAPADDAGIHTYLNDGDGLLIDPTIPFYEQGWYDQDDSNIKTGAGAGLTWSANPSCVGTYTAAPAGGENLPMTCLTWYEAYAFCIWDGGYLPSEAEWEFAAAGGGLELQYPWGSADPGTSGAYATFGCDAGVSCATPVGFTASGIADYGHYDMMGNAAEWVLDDYIGYDDPSTGGEPCVDCLNYDIDGEGNGDESKVARGGGYPYQLGNPALYPPGRSAFLPDSRHAYLGVRCGRNPPP